MALSHKFKHELHCNEIMLLPYYIASMNIEHEYVDLMAEYAPFNGICLADTFELAENQQANLFVPENTERVKRQKETDFTVVIGNPPYNAGQTNENDNNKNRKYETIDARVKETYVKDSKATLLRKLFDPYVKAIRWASDRIGTEGIVALVTNNSFLDSLSFDGMRQHLEQDFSSVYVIDLGGNIRKNPGKTSNVFDIMVGVSINLFVKSTTGKKGIFYYQVNDTFKKDEKLSYLKNTHFNSIKWTEIKPDKKKNWLTEGLHAEFDDFLPLGTKEAKRAKCDAEGVVFKTFSLGVATNRDAWVYNFNKSALADNMQRCINTYNEYVENWINREDKEAKVDDFIVYDDKLLSWSRDLKLQLKRENLNIYANEKIRNALYRPFSKSNLFLDSIMVDVSGQFSKIFPTPSTESENKVICVSDKGSEKPFMVMISKYIVDLHLVGAGSSAQSFPLYTYTD
ncbi:MAG: DNA helicase, partial [Thiomargarita sp.]|nr:DNA helicase [Thiomargarita sp.]